MTATFNAPPHRAGSLPPARSKAGLWVRRPAELGDDVLAVGSYELLLVAPDIVHVDLVEAKCLVLDVLEVLV